MKPLFLFKSEKKTDEGHLKQMREGLRNIFLIWPNTLSYALTRKWDVLSGVSEMAWDVLSGV